MELPTCGYSTPIANMTDFTSNIAGWIKLISLIFCAFMLNFLGLHMQYY